MAKASGMLGFMSLLEYFRCRLSLETKLFWHSYYSGVSINIDDKYYVHRRVTLITWNLQKNLYTNRYWFIFPV